MFPPRWFIPLDVLFQLFTAVVALGIGLHALRGYLWIKERILYALFLAFMLLSAGLFVNGLTLAYAMSAGLNLGRKVALPVEVGYWAYYLLGILALSILAYAYLHRLRERNLALAAGGAAAATSSIVTYGPALELALSALLFIILAAQLAHLQVRRTRTAVLVALGFFLLLASHVLALVSQIGDLVYVASRVVQLGGFLTLLLALYHPRRRG